MLFFTDTAFDENNCDKDDQTAGNNGDSSAQTEFVARKTHKPGKKSASGDAHCRKIEIEKGRIKVGHTLNSVHLGGRPIRRDADTCKEKQSEKHDKQPHLREHSRAQISKQK